MVLTEFCYLQKTGICYTNAPIQMLLTEFCYLQKTEIYYINVVDRILLFTENRNRLYNHAKHIIQIKETSLIKFMNTKFSINIKESSSPFDNKICTPNIQFNMNPTTQLP